MGAVGEVDSEACTAACRGTCGEILKGRKRASRRQTTITPMITTTIAVEVVADEEAEDAEVVVEDDPMPL